MHNCMCWSSGTQLCSDTSALYNPKSSILIQKRHPYTENLNSETPGDSKNAFLHWGDVLGLDAMCYIVGGMTNLH